jgi:ribosomal protein S18 acetylase RimI-like enzyme
VRYVLRLGPGDVGSRVVVRRSLPEGGYADVLGDLEHWDDERVVVRRADGEVVEVDRARVVAGKPVPPAPSRRSRHPGVDQAPSEPVTARAALVLEAVAARGWQPLHEERIGGWRLRASEGFTNRANSVLPLSGPGMAFDDALTRVEAWYAGHGLPARFQLASPGSDALDAELEDRGWTAYDPVDVMVAGAEAVLAGPERVGLPQVLVEEALTDDWLAVYHYRGRDLPKVAPRLLTSAAQQGFARVVEDGRTLAIGRVAVDVGWAGITAMEVAPDARRRGLGGEVLRALVSWGHAHGGVRVYLQVAAENDAGRALYARHGFTRHHGYRYRIAPGAA